MGLNLDDFFSGSVFISIGLDNLVVEWWLGVQQVPGSIPNHAPRHTKDEIKVVPVVPLFSTQH